LEGEELEYVMLIEVDSLMVFHYSEESDNYCVLPRVVPCWEQQSYYPWCIESSSMRWASVPNLVIRMRGVWEVHGITKDLIIIVLFLPP
jgi:hypothetical protein